MSVRVVKLPDVGEGIAEAELVAWHVAVGDVVTTETVVAEVMTDKATVEISAPVAGVVTFCNGQPGDVLAIGSEFVGIETDDAAAAVEAAPRTAVAAAATVAPPLVPDVVPDRVASAPAARQLPSTPPAHAPAMNGERSHHRPAAAPAVRQRARDLGIDLRLVHGSGPAGRVTHADLDAHVDGRAAGTSSRPRVGSDATHTAQIVGLRRKIAERLSNAATRIPHITYVDEVDMTALEELRAKLNDQPAGAQDEPRLTLLPFLVRAIVRAAAEQPHLNATFDDDAGALTTYDAVHVGIATQTPNGLIVPVVRHAETLDLWACAAEITRVSAAARAGTATRQELSGSTITITSLGALGGLVTTPIINHPEVAIVGVNKMQVRPVWDGHTFAPRTMMNLSSSFDHRIVDGWDAATFVQRIKALLETPALLFIERRPA